MNRILVSQNRQNCINNISKYLFLLLKSLRELEVYFPSPNNKYLYRCIFSEVRLTEYPSNKKIILYKIGNKKIFWGFTSTSIYINTSIQFLKKDKIEEIKEEKKIGTVFSLGGDIWGYDINLFNYYNEKEILLESERQFIIESIISSINNVTNITCNILKTPVVLDNLIGKNTKLYNLNKGNDINLI